MRIKVWDLPVRLCHWLLVVAVAGAYISINLNEVEWHERFGFSAATLVIFRVLWGLVGSDTARFARFVPGPGRIIAYLRGRWRGIGHNPLGALSVLALLAAVSVQVGTGIFANDDIFFDAPWSYAVGKELSDQVTGWHKISRWVLLGLIGLHLAAVAVHVFALREPIVRAMVSGRREMEAAQPKLRHPLWAIPVLAVAIFLAGMVFRYWIT